MSDCEEDRHPVDRLADAFAERLRRGEHPSIEEYTSKYPEHADLIRAVFPSVEWVERAAQRESESSIPSLSLSAPSLPTAIPKVFGDFEVVRRIGSGGMGVVYEAIQRSLQRHVALKVMNESISDHSKHRLRFQREAEAAAGLHHTNIVPIFGIGEDHGMQYYAMQLIQGVTVHDVIESLRDQFLHTPAIPSPHLGEATAAAHRLLAVQTSDDSLFHGMRTGEHTSSRATQPSIHRASTVAADSQWPSESHALEEISGESIATSEPLATNAVSLFTPPRIYYRNVAGLIANAANALGYAHHCGVLHRDIKPANLLLDRDGTIWITDFGLARLSDVDGATQPGELLGTLRYMAPEQIRGSGDQRMDIYSLGLTLFELLTLQCGLESPKARLLDPNGNSHVAFTRSQQRVLPRDLQTIVLKACAVEPKNRYQRAADMEEDLRRFIDDRPILARRTSSLEHMGRWARRNPAVATLTGLLFGLLMTLAIILGIWNRQQLSDIKKIEKEFNRAEANLREKTDALTRAEREQSRAEKNMLMALEAFDQITENIAARGGMINQVEWLDEDSTEFADASLSQADVELLQSLLAFFDRFAEENSADLRIEAAIARRRVGEIQSKIGKLDEAYDSLSKSLRELEAIRKADPKMEETILEEIAARKELIHLATKRGQLARANAVYLEARRLLDSNPNVRDSSEGRFALANLLGSMVTVVSKMSPERRRRPAFAWWNRSAPANPPPLANAQLTRLKREFEFNSEALGILDALANESPTHTAYQLALARTHKNQVRLLIGQGNARDAETSLLRAIEIVETLLESHPDSSLYQYELAETLSINVGFRPSDEQRCQRGLEICEKILKAHPNVPEYRALHASILVRLAIQGNPLENRGERSAAQLHEAIAIQTELTEQYPEVALYGIVLVQYEMQLADLYLALKRPEKAREAMTNAWNHAERIQRNGLAQPVIKSIMDRIRERRNNLEEKSN